MIPQAILFDYDGVVLDSEALWGRAEAEIELGTR